MIAIGALCLGLVIGWAAGFVGWSWGGAAYRAGAGAALIASLSGYGVNITLFGLAGLAIGAAGHDGLLRAIQRRGI